MSETKKTDPQFDPVHKPYHYNQGGVETIDGIQAALGDIGLVDHCRGNALKYVWRAGKKGDMVEDLKKAIWYLNKAVSVLEKQR